MDKIREELEKIEDDRDLFNKASDFAGDFFTGDPSGCWDPSDWSEYNFARGFYSGYKARDEKIKKLKSIADDYKHIYMEIEKTNYKFKKALQFIFGTAETIEDAEQAAKEVLEEV